MPTASIIANTVPIIKNMNLQYFYYFVRKYFFLKEKYFCITMQKNIAFDYNIDMYFLIRS